VTNQRNFNGTTFSLGNTVQGNIVSMQLQLGAAKIDVYQPGDLVRLMEAGVPTASISIGLRGYSNVPVEGTKGTPSILLGNGGSVTIPGTTWECMSVQMSGKEDGPWEGTAEYSPTTD
jgi:hypothetical protein